MQSHACPACHDHNDGKDKAEVLLSKEVDDLAVFLGSVELRILKAHCIQGVQGTLGDEQCSKHGKYDTDCQGACEALYRTGTTEIQDCCCDQGGDITIQDCGQCLGETSLDRRFHTASQTNFLFDTGEDNNICIHCHTNRKDDTCNTRKRQGNIKCSQHDEHQTNIQSQGDNRSNTRDQVSYHHEYGNDRKTDRTGL